MFYFIPPKSKSDYSGFSLNCSLKFGLKWFPRIDLSLIATVFWYFSVSIQAFHHPSYCRTLLCFYPFYLHQCTPPFPTWTRSFLDPRLHKLGLNSKRKTRKNERKNKAGYTATSCGRVGRGGNTRLYTFQLDGYGRTDGRTDGQSLL